jgi:RHH-type transcriptional regulator, rel operon repressor / antitoxin RelB
MSEVITIRIDRRTKSRLEKLARTMERTKSYVAAEAIRTYVDLNETTWSKFSAYSAAPDNGRKALSECEPVGS